MAVLPSGDGHPVPLGAAGCKFSAASCGLSPGLASAPPRRGFCKTICALTWASLGPSITQAAPPSSSGLALCGDGEPRLEQGGGAGRGPPGEEGTAEEQWDRGNSSFSEDRPCFLDVTGLSEVEIAGGRRGVQVNISS